ncbi:MAG: porin family protein [Proteobacteria bacterium]|nr:porin family protein [Pseudomonadota bacterium]
MKKFILAALAATAMATPALAQDAAPFTGFRLEGLVGYDHVKGNGGGRDGVAYGIGAGYDFQLGGAVLGIEGEAMDSSAKGCDTNFVTATDRICANAKRDLYAGARIGAAVTPNTLLYAKAGYTNARFGVTYTDSATPTANFSARDNLDGIRVGAGVEQKFGQNLYAKAEYRYSNYEQGISRHQVVGGIGFRF